MICLSLILTKYSIIPTVVYSFVSPNSTIKFNQIIHYYHSTIELVSIHTPEVQFKHPINQPPGIYSSSPASIVCHIPMTIKITIIEVYSVPP